MTVLPLPIAMDSVDVESVGLPTIAAPRPFLFFADSATAEHVIELTTEPGALPADESRFMDAPADDSAWPLEDIEFANIAWPQIPVAFASDLNSPARVEVVHSVLSRQQAVSGNSQVTVSQATPLESASPDSRSLSRSHVMPVLTASDRGTEPALTSESTDHWLGEQRRAVPLSSADPIEVTTAEDQLPAADGQTAGDSQPLPSTAAPVSDHASEAITSESPEVSTSQDRSPVPTEVVKPATAAAVNSPIIRMAAETHSPALDLPPHESEIQPVESGSETSDQPRGYLPSIAINQNPDAAAAAKEAQPFLPFTDRIDSDRSLIARNVEQLVDSAIERAERLVHVAGDRYEIRLDPPELGSLQVTLRRTEQGIEVSFTASDPQTQQLFDQVRNDVANQLAQSTAAPISLQLGAHANDAERQRWPDEAREPAGSAQSGRRVVTGASRPPTYQPRGYLA